MVTIVANWFGHGKKGLIMGIWNSHTSVGNILGSLLAGTLRLEFIKKIIVQNSFPMYFFLKNNTFLNCSGIYVDTSWGLSFIVPGLITALVGVLNWFVLVPKPEDVGLDVSHAAVRWK